LGDKKTKITTAMVELLAKDGQDKRLWDGALPSFGAQIWRSGKIVYNYRYQAGGVQRWWRIGRHGDLIDGERPTWRADEKGQPITAERARRAAKRLTGSRPAEDREAARAAAASSPTVQQKAEAWLARLEAIGRSQKTLHEYRRLLMAHVFAAKGKRDRLGAKPIAAVTPHDIEAIHTRLRDTPTQANRLVDVLSALFTWANVEPNPALRRKVERYEDGERKRERHLSDNELSAIGKALRDAAKTLDLPLIVIGFFRLLLLTGCRPGELTRLRWDDVDLEAGRIWLGRTKTRSRDPRAKTGIVVTPPAADVIATQPRIEGNPYVFPGRTEGSHINDYRKPWLRLLELAGLPSIEEEPDLVPYVARHTVGTVGGSSLNLRLVSQILGHSQIRTTERYAHADENPLERGAARIARRIAQSMAREPDAADQPAKRVKRSAPRSRTSTRSLRSLSSTTRPRVNY
jgi:integrase